MPEIYHVRAEHVRPGQQHVFVAMPVGAPVDAAMLDFVLQASRKLDAEGIASDFFFLANHCHVDDSRNYLVWEFLNTDCTDFFFVDADTMSSHDAMARLLKHPHEVIAGLYPYKGDTEAYPVRLLPDASVRYDAHGCVEVESVPTGFLRIKREVLEKMEAVSVGYWNKEVTQADGHRPIPLLFERGLEFTGATFEGRRIAERWGGDFNWCRKWAAVGGKFFVDPSLWFHHYGTKAYRGNVGVYWAKNRGQQTPAFDEAMEALLSGAPLAAHFGRLLADWGNEYAARPDLLAAAYWIVREAGGPVLETGSGLSTLVIGAAAKLAGVELHSLEHDPDHYRRTVDALKRYGMGHVHAHYAPLNRIGGSGPGSPSFIWYALSECQRERLDREVGAFDVVFCDGPQQRWGRGGLYQCLGHLIAGAKIVMDDAGTDQRALAALNAWAKESGRDPAHVVTSGERPFAVAMPPKLSTAA